MMKIKISAAPVDREKNSPELSVAEFFNLFELQTLKWCAKVWAQETEWSRDLFTHNLKDNNFNTYLYLWGGFF